MVDQLLTTRGQLRQASSYEVDVNCMNYSGYSSVVQNDVGKKHKILDTGCGTGLAGELLLNSISTPQAIQLYGGDISTEMLKIAKSKGIYTELQVINLKEELPYEANSFDSVICVGACVWDRTLWPGMFAKHPPCSQARLFLHCNS